MEAETRKHIQEVAKYLNLFSMELMKRAIDHDASKLEEPEASIFEAHTHRLSGVTYGSEEYHKMLAELKPALDHHYAHNRHHPEYNDVNGFSFQTLNDPIRSMDLIDIVEMICDWLAATKRHADGNIGASITRNTQRFKLDGQLEAILRNTAEVLKKREESRSLRKVFKPSEKEIETLKTAFLAADADPQGWVVVKRDPTSDKSAEAV